MLSKRAEQERSSDDSEDENLQLRTGSVPKAWYNKEEHVGYNVKGERMAKPKAKSQMDRLIEAEENPEFWRYVYDEMMGEEVYLGDEQLALIQKIKNRVIVDDYIRNKDYTIDVEVDETEMHREQIKKSSFLPSKAEQKKIAKIVRGIRSGFIKLEDDRPPKDPVKDFLSDVQDSWLAKDPRNMRLPNLLPPKLPLPGHEASFNPLPELFKEDIQPKTSLRSLGSSAELLKDQFERLLSLYLAPRVEKKKIHMKKEDLLQELPSLEELKPFPTKCVIKSLTSFAHATHFDLSPDDTYTAVGDAFGNVIFMHTMTSVIIHRLKVEGGPVVAVRFLSKGLLLVATEKHVEFWAFKFALSDWEEARERFETIANGYFTKHGKINDGNFAGDFSYAFPAAIVRGEAVVIPKRPISCLMSIRVRSNRILMVDVHHKGQFMLLTTAKPDDTRKIDVISLPRCSGTVIQVKAKTKIQKCIFHTSKPLIFIMTQAHIFLYELQKQTTKKKLVAGNAGLTDLALHKTGDHLIVTTADACVLWFDLDSGQCPYKKMKVHNAVVNCCAFSAAYQLFVSTSAAGELVVQHAMVETEYFGYPTITPLKMLSNQFPKGNQSVPQARFFHNKYFLAAIGVDGQLMIWA